MPPERRYDERSRMGRISGGLWTIGALVGIVGTFLPGASHQGVGVVLAVSFVVLAYGLGSLTGLIPWEDASLRALAIGMVVTIPVVALAIYLTGASISYVEPLLVCSLLYAALFFPPRWAWPLAIELVLAAGAPLLYDDTAIENAFLPRYLALAVGFLAVTAVMVNLKRHLVEAEERQRLIANSDPLTGILNRRAFDEALRRELEARNSGEAEAEADPLALFIVDLDDFKAINDDHGHQVGDAVLRRSAERAASVLRSGDVLARIGGDEFAALAPGARGDAALALAESVQGAVAARDQHSSLPAARASVGLAVFPEDGLDFESLMRTADQRLLRSKSGKAHFAERARGRGPLRLI